MNKVESLLASKAQGCMMGLLVGDALGTAVEGFPPEDISHLASSFNENQSQFITHYIPAIQMGSVTPLRTEIGYRWATEVTDETFVSPGPHPNPQLANFLRYGNYSDDGNSCIALAESLLECKGLNGPHAAVSYAKAWKTAPTRGYPPSAKMVLDAILKGADYKVTGQPPFFPFQGGSFANGGAMRISPLAIAYRNASSEVLRAACAEAIRSSHVHEEAIDGAVVQATAVRRALNTDNTQDFDSIQLLDELISVVKTKAMRDRLISVKREYEQVVQQLSQQEQVDKKEASSSLTTEGAGGDNDGIILGSLDLDYEIDKTALEKLVTQSRPGSGLGFQIASIDAIPCVLWVILRYAAKRPREVLSRAIAVGGDTDTIASMAGAVVGALHGLDCNILPSSLLAKQAESTTTKKTSTVAGVAATTHRDGCWIAPHLIEDLENGERGRDYAMQLAARLCDLDL